MIGLISFHCQYNYGSALQAWAMQTTLGQLGYESKFLNFYAVISQSEISGDGSSKFQNFHKSIIYQMTAAFPQ